MIRDFPKDPRVINIPGTARAIYPIMPQPRHTTARDPTAIHPHTFPTIMVKNLNDPKSVYRPPLCI